MKSCFLCFLQKLCSHFFIFSFLLYRPPQISNISQSKKGSPSRVTRWRLVLPCATGWAALYCDKYIALPKGKLLEKRDYQNLHFRGFRKLRIFILADFFLELLVFDLVFPMLKIVAKRTAQIKQGFAFVSIYGAGNIPAATLSPLAALLF